MEKLREENKNVRIQNASMKGSITSKDERISGLYD